MVGVASGSLPAPAAKLASGKNLDQPTTSKAYPPSSIEPYQSSAGVVVVQARLNAATTDAHWTKFLPEKDPYVVQSLLDSASIIFQFLF